MFVVPSLLSVTFSVAPPPTVLQAGEFVVVRESVELAAPAAFLVVATGEFTAGDVHLQAGDSLRATEELVHISGTGELLVITFEQ